MSATAAIITPEDLHDRHDERPTLARLVPQHVCDSSWRAPRGREAESEVAELQRRSDVIRQVFRCVGELREVTGVRQLIELAPSTVCKLGFDRAMVSKVEESTWTVECTHSKADPSRDTRATDDERRHQRVASTMLEAEIIRRRISLLVTDAQNDPRVHRGLASATRSRSYVAAPVMPAGRVIGFVHADRYDQGVDVDEFDREVLSIFAEQFGRVLERAVLLERFDNLRRTVDRLTESLGGIVSGCVRSEVEMMECDSPMDLPSLGIGPNAPVVPAEHPDDVLTNRELEVVQLMASGYTNSRIAKSLVISEGTVKSHVKHILRKLSAANRAEAVSRWFQRPTAS
jgi:DNA-binding CsgD family transcriptional regulator/GAF domain-containing protein